MFFGIFVLNRVSNLSFFVLIRVLIYQYLSQTGCLFLDDKQQNFYKRLLINIRVNSVLNRVGKSTIFVSNRGRAAPPHPGRVVIEYPPPRDFGLSFNVFSISELALDSFAVEF